MFLLQVIEEVDQLCAIYDCANDNKEKEKLCQILKAKQNELSSVLQKLTMSLSKLENLLNPPKRSEEVYNVYNI